MSDELLKLLADKADLTLEHMRGIRTDMAKLNTRLDTIEKGQLQGDRLTASVKRDTADIFEIMTDYNVVSHAIIERLDRLERHAGLTDALSQ